MCSNLFFSLKREVNQLKLCCDHLQDTYMISDLHSMVAQHLSKIMYSIPLVILHKLVRLERGNLLPLHFKTSLLSFATLLLCWVQSWPISILEDTVPF